MFRAKQLPMVKTVAPGGNLKRGRSAGQQNGSRRLSASPRDGQRDCSFEDAIFRASFMPNSSNGTLS